MAKYHPAFQNAKTQAPSITCTFVKIVVRTEGGIIPPCKGVHILFRVVMISYTPRAPYTRVLNVHEFRRRTDRPFSTVIDMPPKITRLFCPFWGGRTKILTRILIKLLRSGGKQIGTPTPSHWRAWLLGSHLALIIVLTTISISEYSQSFCTPKIHTM